MPFLAPGRRTGMGGEHPVPSIRVKNGPSQGQVFKIGEKPLSIGRDDACDFPLQDKGASRRHAEVFRIGDMCFIRDLDSKNGTFVNDARIGEEMLRDGDRIQIGGTVILFEPQSAPESGDGPVFYEDDLEGMNALRLEDLTAANVAMGDISSERHLRALYRLTRLMASEDTEEKLIQKTLAFAAEALQADGAYLFGRGQRSGSVVTLGSHVPDGAKAGRLSRTIIRKVLQDKRALLVTDAMRDDRFASNESVMRHHIHAVLCAPVDVREGAECVLYLAGDDPAASFNEQELELAAAMADHFGLALANISSRVRRREYMLSAVRLLLIAADSRRPGIHAANERLAAVMRAVGGAMELGLDALERLQLAAMLHNYSLMTVSGGDAPEEERVAATVELLSRETFYPEIADIVQNQLERYDGGGPKGLRGATMPLGVRIFQVARDLVSAAGPPGGDGGRLVAAATRLLDAPPGHYDPDVMRAVAAAGESGALELSLEEQWRRRRSRHLTTILNQE